MTQRNTPERREMLAARAEEQANRTTGFTLMRRKPVGFSGKWHPAMTKDERDTSMIGVPAAVNRRTGKPHADNRQKAKCIRRFFAALAFAGPCEAFP